MVSWGCAVHDVEAGCGLCRISCCSRQARSPSPQREVQLSPSPPTHSLHLLIRFADVRICFEQFTTNTPPTTRQAGQSSVAAYKEHSTQRMNDIASYLLAFSAAMVLRTKRL